MKSFAIIITLFLMLFPFVAQADPGDTLWTRLYGGGGDDIAFSLARTQDSGFIIAGCTDSYGNGGLDFYLVRLSPEGDTLWTQTYGGSDDDIAASVQEVDDGGFIVAGMTRSFGAGASDFYLVNTDSLGNLRWARTYGGAQDDSAKCVRQTSDGDFVICGSTESFGNGGSDIYVVKTNAHGGLEWTHTTGGIINDGAYCIRQTSDDSYILAGWTGGSDGNHDIYIEKLNSAGQTSWYRGYHPGVDNQAYSIIQTSDDNFAVAGYTFGNPDLLDFYLMKISPSGGLIWERRYGGSSWEMAHCVKETPDEGLVIFGSRWVSIFPDTTELYLVRADQNGNRLWDRAYSFAHLDEGTAIEVTNDGNYLLAGYTSLWDHISYDLCLVMVQGDAATQTEDDTAPIPGQAAIETAYPNPFNAEVMICYYLPEDSQVRIDIYDILGRQIARLDDNWQSAGRHTVTWNSTGQSSGSYFCRLRAGATDRVVSVTVVK